jgi:hypothetical protein
MGKAVSTILTCPVQFSHAYMRGFMAISEHPATDYYCTESTLYFLVSGHKLTWLDQHPSLRPLKIHLSLLQAQLSQWHHKYKFARTQIRNLISSFQPTDLPNLVYSAHLAAISLYSAIHYSPPALPGPHLASFSRNSLPTNSLQDTHAALSAVQDMESLSLKHGHTRITLLALILRLRIAVAANMWQDAGSAISRVEAALGLSYDPSNSSKVRQPAALASTKEACSKETTFVFFESPFEAAMAVHGLIMSVLYFTHAGLAAEAAPRLSHLHALLDSGALEKFPDGTIEVGISMFEHTIYSERGHCLDPLCERPAPCFASNTSSSSFFIGLSSQQRR